MQVNVNVSCKSSMLANASSDIDRLEHFSEDKQLEAKLGGNRPHLFDVEFVILA